MRGYVWPTAVLVQTIAEMQLTEASACTDVCSAAKILTIQLQQHKRKLRSISEKKKNRMADGLLHLCIVLPR
jgi:hypothetical protein